MTVPIVKSRKCEYKGSEPAGRMKFNENKTSPTSKTPTLLYLNISG